jgi:hypothetical protein
MGIAKHISTNPFLPTSARRAFNKVRSAIKAMALFHQHQRERDDQGRVVADMIDYFLVYQVFDQSFRENIGQGKEYTDPRIRVIEKLGPITLKDLSGIEKVSVPTLTEWVGQRTAKGLLVWCDENGSPFPDEGSLSKARHCGKAFIRLAYPCGLPTPFELTGDQRWNEGGELYEIFDLEFQGKIELAGSEPKTQDPALLNSAQQEGNSETISEIQTTTGARAFGLKEVGSEKNIQHIPATELETDMDQLTEDLYKEFSQYLVPGHLS